MGKDFESIKSKVLKLKALAERGEQGEAINAKRLLDQLLASYGFTLEEILAEPEEKKYFVFNVKENAYGFSLFIQCYAKVTGQKRIKYEKRRRYVTVELTKFQYAELKALYDWHYRQLTKELKRVQNEFMEAYINKHDLFSGEPSEGGKSLEEMTPDELERLFRVLRYTETVEDTSYRKMIGKDT